jgi:hypothetical protein
MVPTRGGSNLGGRRSLVDTGNMRAPRNGTGGSFIGHGSALRLLRQGCALPRISSVRARLLLGGPLRTPCACFVSRFDSRRRRRTHMSHLVVVFFFVKPLLIVIFLYLCVFRGLGGVTLARPRRLCRRHRPPVAAARALRRPTCPGRPTCPAQPTVRCRCGCVRGPAPIRSSSPSTSAPMAASAASVMSPSARPARHWRPVVA